MLACCFAFSRTLLLFFMHSSLFIHRQKIFSSFALIFVLSFCVQSDLNADEISLSEPGDFVYQPIPESEGYMQAWNVNFRGNGYYIYLTYLVSNMGPGSYNNGVSVLVFNKGQSRVWTAEYSERSLTAAPGQFGIKSGRSQLSFENGKYIARVVMDDLRINLQLTPLAPGVRLSGGRIPVAEDQRKFIRADIPVSSAAVTGLIAFDNISDTLNGVGGLEYLMTNESPHTYAKRFSLIRSYTADQGIFVGGFYGTPNFPGSMLIRAAVMKNGRIFKTARVSRIQTIEPLIDPLSGYLLARKTVFFLDGDGDCSILEERLYSTGGFYIISHISTLLRWVIRVLFAKPYIVHYGSRLTYSCESGLTKESPVIFNDAQSSHYLINE